MEKDYRITIEIPDCNNTSKFTLIHESEEISMVKHAVESIGKKAGVVVEIPDFKKGGGG